MKINIIYNVVKEIITFVKCCSDGKFDLLIMKSIFQEYQINCKIDIINSKTCVGAFLKSQGPKIYL